MGKQLRQRGGRRESALRGKILSASDMLDCLGSQDDVIGEAEVRPLVVTCLVSFAPS